MKAGSTPFATRFGIAAAIWMAAGIAALGAVSPAARIRDAAQQDKAEKSKSNESLVEAIPLTLDDSSLLAIPALSPWGIVTLEPVRDAG